jgi:hypothetical protein
MYNKDYGSYLDDQEEALMAACIKHRTQLKLLPDYEKDPKYRGCETAPCRKDCPLFPIWRNCPTCGAEIHDDPNFGKKYCEKCELIFGGN